MGQCKQFGCTLRFASMTMTRAPLPVRRFRPRLLPTVVTLAAVALFVTAGHWQRSRMEQKAELRAQFDAANAMTPATLPADTADWTAWRYRPVAADGTFDASRQILVDNKVEEGRAGYHVVTPLLLADGRAVLVDRGWIAAGDTRAHLPMATPPAGQLTVQSRVNIPTSNYVELAPATPVGVVWQNLDPPRFASVTGLNVLPIILEQTAPIGATDNLVRNWPAPDFGIDRHRIYMVQWYLFAATAAGLWLFFNLRPARGKDMP
jgi:surfeit locus 1 family protein